MEIRRKRYRRSICVRIFTLCLLGVAGENLVGCCLLQGSPLHKKLSIHVLETYPKLVNDIFVSEDYYGNEMLISFESIDN